jgi:hypothetical protein
MMSFLRARIVSLYRHPIKYNELVERVMRDQKLYKYLPTMVFIMLIGMIPTGMKNHGSVKIVSGTYGKEGGKS